MLSSVTFTNFRKSTFALKSHWISSNLLEETQLTIIKIITTTTTTTLDLCHALTILKGTLKVFIFITSMMMMMIAIGQIVLYLEGKLSKSLIKLVPIYRSNSFITICKQVNQLNRIGVQNRNKIANYYEMCSQNQRLKDQIQIAKTSTIQLTI